MSRSRSRWLLWSSLAAFATGCFTFAPACSGGAQQGPACSPDIVSIQKIFAGSCTQQGCHAATSPAALLNLETGDIAAALVGLPSSTCDGQMRVVPGSPEQSFLYEKITAEVPKCGDRMPRLSALSAEAQECVKQWIASLPPLTDAGTDGPTCETCGGSQCIDLNTDPAHCGECTTACPPGASCGGGMCACGSGLTQCGSSCVDTQLDMTHCGGCDSPCPTGGLCSGGQCACAAGLEPCGGVCVDTSSNPSHCGSCGIVCTGGQVCNAGMCSNVCGMLTQCGTACVDTDTSVTDCGGCGDACPAGASCVGGSCECPAGTSACAGACINTSTDPANCGGCGIICTQGMVCEASSCVCPGGGMVCGASCVDHQTDPANCGTCGNACVLGRICSAGSCTCGTMSVSFSAAVQPIFTASCAVNGCHAGATPKADMELTAGIAYSEIFNVNASECTDGRKRVLPGEPAESYIIDKLMGVDYCAGAKMPKGGSLATMQIEIIANWICAGAPDN